MGDENDVDNGIVPHNLRDSNNAHNGKQVSLVALSPNGKYVVTYSEDNESIERWIVIDSELILDPEARLSPVEESAGYIHEIKVNDSKVVCYIRNSRINVLQMSNEHHQIKLHRWEPKKINFKKNGDFILSNKYKILIYHSKHDKMSNVLSLVSSHELSSYNDVINGMFIDDDNIWGISSNYLFHWDLETFKLKFSYSLGFTTEYWNEEFTVITKGNLIAVNYHNEINEIAIFLKDVHFPIRNIQLKSSDMKIEFCEVQNNFYLLAFNIPKKNENQNIILYSIIGINKHIDASKIFNNEDSENDSKNNFILYKYNSESKEAFGLVNGKFSYVNLPDLNWYKFFEPHKEEDDFVGWNNYLCQASEASEINYYNDTLAFPDMENIRSLIANKRENTNSFMDMILIDFNNQKYKWKIDLENSILSVYNDEELLCSKDMSYLKDLLNWEILNNNTLALLIYNFITIYEYDFSNKNIKIQYQFYKNEGLNIKDFSGPILPIDNDSPDEFVISSIIKDERCLARYGLTLLPILIESSNPKLTCYIEDIYNKCIKLVKEDPKGNMKFLNIITSFMNDLYKKHPDYITKFISEMFMILDPYNEKINSDEDYSYFCTFSQEIEIINPYNALLLLYPILIIPGIL
ncbi:unnamed protein product [Rhizophagus irregularis]|nr:unnamed protein product [Rhizophagus irregularis]